MEESADLNSTFEIKNKKTKSRIATRAAMSMPPYVYKITERLAPEQPLRIFALGCQGEGKEAQKEVAKLMAQIAEEENRKPDFILLLGDNIYSSGAKSPNDSAFKKVFENIYQKYPSLKDIPFFPILGNHDENLHLFALHSGGLTCGYHEIAHTYFLDPLRTLAQFEGGEIPLNKTSGWIMPSPFYAINCGDTQIFCINSNHYVNDFLIAETERYVNPVNQALWLKQEVEKAKAAGKKVILALHHPLVPMGRREYSSDFNFYFKTKEEIDRAANYFGFTKRPSYNKLLYLALKKQALTFDVVLAAHDHVISYYNNTDQTSDYDDESFPLRQFILGGGGGILQKRLNFKDQAYLGCFLKRHGFAEITFDHTGIYTTIHTLSHPNALKFNQINCQPERHYGENLQEKKDTQQFCQTIKFAVDDYLGKFISSKQEKLNGQFFSPLKNISHGSKGIDRAHAVWAYISEHRADDFVTTVNIVHELATWKKNPLIKPHRNSFINKINQRLLDEYGMDLEDFYLEVCRPQRRAIR